jgi:Ser/Thr protein kinase RdoA (MazF antagonist)
LRLGGKLPIRDRAAFEMETAWVESLASSTLVVPRVRRTTTGARVADVDGRPACVYSWVRGRRCRDRSRPKYAYELGEALAHLHAATVDFAAPQNARVKDWDAARMCGYALSGRAPGPELVAAVAKLGPTDWQLINADIGLHNTAWLAHVPGLYDFNDTGWGYTGFDIARFVFGLDDVTKGCALRGYASVAPLPDSYLEFGDAFETAAAQFLAAYRASKSRP